MAQIIQFSDEIITGSAIAQFDDIDLSVKHGTGKGSDHTICGMAYGEYVTHVKSGKINCKDCIGNILFAKKFKKGKDY